MKNIKLDKWYKKTIYYLGWVYAIGSGIIIWIILGTLYYTRDIDVEKRKGYLNKSYQKFIYVYCIIMLILTLFWGIFMEIIG